MALKQPKDMDGYLPLLGTTDTKAKLSIAAFLVAYLDAPDSSIECSDIGRFIDSLIPWMQSSNYKVSQFGIEAMTSLVAKMGHDFRPYLPTVLPPIVDRLGDSKELVREQAQLLILKLLESDVLTPSTLFDKLGPAFSHKNGKVREEVLNCLSTTLSDYGVASIGVSRLVPGIVKLLSDPISPVRDAAFDALVKIYTMVGERLRLDLQRKHSVPAAKLTLLMARFDEALENGEVVASTNGADHNDARGNGDVVDAACVRTVAKPSANAIPRKGSFSASRAAASAATTSSGPAGSVDEDTFQRAFLEVPPVQVFSGRELDKSLTQIRTTLQDTTVDWSRRVEALKRVRSLVAAGAANYEEFSPALRLLEPAVQAAVKDLRSQVVREACLTIAFLAQERGFKLEHFSETLLPSLLNLIQNSAKIVATSGGVAARFVVRYVPSARLLPAVCNGMTSKSREIRRACADLLHQALNTWPPHVLEKQLPALQEAIRKGVADADNDVRVTARQGYWSFHRQFPDQADSLLSSLEPMYRRALGGESGLSAASSTGSLNQQRHYVTPRLPRNLPSSATGSTENLPSASGARSRVQRSGIPVLSPGPRSVDLAETETEEVRKQRSRDLYHAMIKKTSEVANEDEPRRSPAVSLRSTSAIDLQAAQRAKARAQYAAMARMNVGSNASLPRPRRSPDTMATPPSAERPGRTRGRISGVSQSQPSSRSGSPSSRLSYATFAERRDSVDHATPRPGRLNWGVPRSGGSSRDSSPSRPLKSRVSNARPHAARMLQASRDAEQTLMDGDSDPESETSSCSERSFDSPRRDSFSWASRSREEPRDINDIIARVSSTHWADRKDGLVALQAFFAAGRLLSGSELRRVTDLFAKMFVDAHTKVFSLFLDVLNELVSAHRADLDDWLYLLLTRLLAKLGGDLLGSISSKLNRSLGVVRDSFPRHRVLAAALRLLVDPALTPNLKVKLALLGFLTDACRDGATGCDLPRDISTPLARLVSWTSDSKPELRTAAATALEALFDLDTPKVTLALARLPPQTQEAASALVQAHLARSRNGTPVQAQSPSRSLRGPRPDQPFTSEEVYKSLRRTTAEIQSYSFEAPAPCERDSTSQDSGVGVGGGSGRSSALSSPTLRLRETAPLDANDYTMSHEDGFPHAHGGADLGELIRKCAKTLEGDDYPGRKVALFFLLKLIPDAPSHALQDSLRMMLKVLLAQQDSTEVSCRSLSWLVLAELLKRPELRAQMHAFSELLLLKALESHSDPDKEVLRCAESCAGEMGAVLPAEVVVRVVKPLIKTGEYPVNQGAIKILTRAVQSGCADALEPHLQDIMSGLFEAYDHQQSPVRKCAVFCIVALHGALGEDKMAPYLRSLNSSKLKLLHLYIRRMSNPKE